MNSQVAVKELDAINRAVATATRLEETPQVMDELEGEIKRYRKVAERLLPVEERAKDDLDRKINDLLAKRLSVEYPLLSPEVFGWRNRDGFPQLALFSLEDPRFSIAYDRWSGLTFSRSVPPGLYGFYDDMRQVLARRKWHEGEVWNASIEARYEGVIPDSTREKISAAQKTKQFPDMYILAEVRKWEVNRVTLPLGDPLVLGRTKGGYFYLIDKYDTTTIEELAAAEYTTSSTK